ncbi:hypothetical protein [Saccharothrix yanglingensis]|uniref:hypothetical protein n=1 Tax=Saccharothrix yanglingensis TaxID=659496 RepID=UPI0027D23C0D|nr:hypothetical protein [Saccharothrix yanglingensis]
MTASALSRGNCSDSSVHVISSFRRFLLPKCMSSPPWSTPTALVALLRILLATIV